MNRRERRAAQSSPSRLFAQALQHHDAGNLQQAEQLYRQVLAANPQHADSMHLLGVLAADIGRHDLAVDLIGRAIALSPGAALYHSNLGNAFKQLGRLDDAVASYCKALSLQPEYPEACNNLGSALLAQAQTDAAIAWLQRAITLKPDLVEAHNNLGNAMCAQGRPEAALACYETAIVLRPDDAAAHANLGAALTDLDRLDQAERCYRRAIAADPAIAETHTNLAIVLKRQGRLEDALASGRRAILLRADLPEAYDTLGTTLADLGRLEEASARFREAIALRPAYAEAHDNLGTVLHQQSRLDEAIACFRTAIDLREDFANAHHNLAMALLSRGDFAEGWREYEWRWRTPHLRPTLRHFDCPQWQGEAAPGRVLLIHAEQGMGDTIQFCRYATLAAAGGARVTLEVQPPLVRLLRGLPGVSQVLARGEALPAFDLHCPMLSLPLAFATTLATIPSAEAYLHAEPALVARWSACLAPQPRVGLVWAGGPATATDARRSCPPARLGPLFEVPGWQFVSLQKAGPPPPADAPLLDLMADMTDFADTAALIASLDLVISVDTAIAHLAAALGKPVWLLDRFDPDWRWLTDRCDSPWYPTLHIFRQPAPGDWDTVIQQVSDRIRNNHRTVKAVCHATRNKAGSAPIATASDKL